MTKIQLQFARTLICQGTLAPLSQNTMPIYWNMDASLALYPLPDLVVVGDPSKPFEIQHQGCTVVNTVITLLNLLSARTNFTLSLFNIYRDHFQSQSSRSKCTFHHRRLLKTLKSQMTINKTYQQFNHYI